MGLINGIFRFFMLDRLKGIQAYADDPHGIQHKVLDDLLQAGKQTEYGKRWGFGELSDYRLFQGRLPLNTYEEIKPDIVRMMDGEEDVLWPGLVEWFAKSSGTTDDRSKFIPISKESLDDCHFKAGKDMYAVYYKLYPKADLAGGKTLVLGGSHQIHQSKKGIYYGDLSAVLMQNTPIWAEAKRVPALSIALMDNWEKKIGKMAEATLNQPITNILGVPTWTIVLIRRLFEMTGKDNLADIWPRLELYAHGGVSFTPYRDLFRQLIRSPRMHYMETYNASEGYFGLQDEPGSDDLLLMLDYGIFYEFLPLGSDNMEHAIPLEGVRTGQVYEIVITTNGGLWRYRLGDTVEFTATRPYRIKIAGRTKHFINAFGEELMVDNAERAIAEACRQTGCSVADFTAAPVYFSGDGNGAHEWLIEFEKPPSNLDDFQKILDTSLRQVNSDYDAKRSNDLALRPPILHSLRPGTFYAWMKHRGKLGGQNKVPRLSNHRQFVEDILNYVKG